MPPIPRWAFVIDLETTDTRPTAEVLTIGIAVVDTLLGKVLDETCHLVVSLDQQIGRTRSAETLAWWRGIRGKAHEIAFSPNRLPLKTCLDAVDNFLNSAGALGDSTVWGNGATFDIVIMESLFAAEGRAAPWSYRDIRDLRTIYEAAGVESDDVTSAGLVKHVAVDDAIEEARRLVKALGVLGLRAQSGDVVADEREA